MRRARDRRDPFRWARIPTEIDFDQGEADALLHENGVLGELERVDRAMVPILAKIGKLQGELAVLPDDPGQELAANAVPK